MMLRVKLFFNMSHLTPSLPFLCLWSLIISRMNTGLKLGRVVLQQTRDIMTFQSKWEGLGKIKMSLVDQRLTLQFGLVHTCMCMISFQGVSVGYSE